MSYDDFLVAEATDIEEEENDFYPDDDAGYEAWKDDQAQIEDERLADLQTMLQEFNQKLC